MPMVGFEDVESNTAGEVAHHAKLYEAAMNQFVATILASSV